jgi:hypothetical protein
MAAVDVAPRSLSCAHAGGLLDDFILSKVSTHMWSNSNLQVPGSSMPAWEGRPPCQWPPLHQVQYSTAGCASDSSETRHGIVNVHAPVSLLCLMFFVQNAWLH